MTISTYLVDDHAAVIDGLRALLEAEPDIEVIGHAANGRAAVDEVCKLVPDVVVMDIEMPEMNGIEATQQIHDRCPSVKTLMLSVHAGSEHVFRALWAGARGYLPKTSGGKELIDALRTVNAGKRYFAREIAEIVIDDFIGERRALSPLDRLSSRERQVLQLLVEGKSIAVIAETLTLSPRSIETYRTRLMQKLGIDNLPALVKFAILHGITPLE